jgi:putative NIF3 family GTP cyclohydrolase 1 type 2
MKAMKIVDFVNIFAPHEAGVPNDGQSGWKFGDPEQEIGAVAVCWSPTFDVLKRCIELGANMIICHEPLLFSASNGPWYKEKSTEEKEVNLRRLEILKKYGICVYGCHSNWDVKERIGVVDTLGELLGFKKVVGKGFCTRVYQVEPIPLWSLADKVKIRVRSEKVLVIGDLDRKVTKIGTSIGGLGQMFTSPEEIHALGAEVGIFGEMLEYTRRYAIELGLSIIEAGHSSTEMPGLENLAKAIKDKFSVLKVFFLENTIPWRYM